MNVTEVTRADAWLHDRLTASVAITSRIGLRIYAHLAPDVLDPLPLAAPEALEEAYVVWGFNSADDLNGVDPDPGRRIITVGTWAVKAVGPVAAPSELEVLADGIDQALDGASATTVDGLRVTAVRIAPLLYPELDAGRRRWWHVGGTFRLEITT